MIYVRLCIRVLRRRPCDRLSKQLYLLGGASLGFGVGGFCIDLLTTMAW